MEKGIKKSLIFFECLSIIWFLSLNTVFAQERELLYSNQSEGQLPEMIAKIQAPNQEKVPYFELTPHTEYFVRLIPRQYVVTEGNDIQENATLGTKPFVFFTTSEGIYGKSLLDIYLDIGYEAEDIIRWQRDQDMVAVVFRYPEPIVLSTKKNGALSAAWKKTVYIPTWDNVFALFHHLAKQATITPDKSGEFAPKWLFFRTNALKDFVLSFPEIGKQKIKTTTYLELKANGGADWKYRELLENKLSIFEHFRGNGRTLNEIVDPEGIKTKMGLFEFIGPNMKINELSEIAVIYLGKLTITDSYFK